MALSPVFQAIGKAQSLARPLPRDGSDGRFVKAATVLAEAKRVMAECDLHFWISASAVLHGDNSESAIVRRTYCIQHSPSGEKFLYEQDWPINPKWRVSASLTSATKRALVDVFLLAPGAAKPLIPPELLTEPVPPSKDFPFYMRSAHGSLEIEFGRDQGIKWTHTDAPGEGSSPSPKSGTIPAPSKPERGSPPDVDGEIAIGSRPCAFCQGKVRADAYWVLLDRPVRSEMPGSGAAYAAVAGVYRCSINRNGARLVVSKGELLGIKPSECLDVCGSCAAPEWYRAQSFDEDPEKFRGMIDRRFPVGSVVRHRGAADMRSGIVEPRVAEDRDVCPGYPLVRWPLHASGNGAGFYHPRALVNEEAIPGISEVHVLTPDFNASSRFRLRALCGESESSIGAAHAHFMTTQASFATCESCKRLASGSSPEAAAQTGKGDGVNGPVVPVEATPVSAAHTLHFPGCERQPGGCGPDVTTGATADTAPPGSASGIMTGVGESGGLEGKLVAGGDRVVSAPVDVQEKLEPVRPSCPHGKCDGSGTRANGEICLCARGVAPMTKTPPPAPPPKRPEPLTSGEIASRLGTCVAVDKWVSDLCARVGRESGTPGDQGVFPYTDALMARAVSVHGRKVVDEAWEAVGGKFNTVHGQRSWKLHFTKRSRIAALIRALPARQGASDLQAGAS